MAHTTLSRDHQPASEIRRIGREQIDAYGTTRFVERAVVKARQSSDEGRSVFEVEDQEGEIWRGRKILLATGVKDILPTHIEGYEDCWGDDIYHCLFCDGLERSDRPAGMLGFEGPEYLHVLRMAFQLGCPSVTIYSNGPLKPKDNATAEALEIAKANVKVDERRIKRLVHLADEQGIDVVFEDGDVDRIGFLQHTPRTEVVAPNLARDLGVEILPDGRGGTILKRNEPFGETNVKGCFAAGDASVVMKQFTIAMTQGLTAGPGIAIQLGEEDDQEIVERLKKTGVLES